MRFYAQKLKLFAGKSLLLLLVATPILTTGFAGKLFVNNQAYAATSSTINFQARLMNAAGAIAPDGDYNVEFKIYDTASSGGTAQGVCTGNCKWVETRTSANKVHVANGYISVQLGSVTAFGTSINWDQQLWITMNIGGTGSPSWDGEMSPRLQLTAVPYAFRAGQLASLAGSNTAVLQFAASFGQNTTITLPDPGAGTATVCYQASTSCGFVTGASTNFIQNGTTVQTAANFNIRSTAAGSVVAVIQGTTSQTADLLDVQTWNGTTNTTVFGVGANGQITLGGGLTPDITTATAATANGITLQPGVSSGASTTGAATTIKAGDASGTTTVTAGTLTLQGGSATGGSGTRTGGDVTIDGGTGATANGNINIGTANAPTVNIGSVGTTAKATTVHIADTTTTTGGAIQSVTIGSNSNLAHTTVIQGGNSNTAGSEAIRLVPQTTGGIAIGSTTGTGTITLGQSTAANTINVGNADFTGANTQTINIANGLQTTGSSTLNVNILSNTGNGNAGTAFLRLGNNDRVQQIDIGNVASDGNRSLNVFSGNTIAGVTDTLNIGTGNAAGSKVIHIGDGTPTGSGVNTITVGSTALTSTTTINGGTGSGAVSIQAGTSGTVSVGTANLSAINIGYASSTTTLAGTVKVSTLAASTANSASVCRDTSTNTLTSCDTNTTGKPFLQGGNTFGVAGDLGTNDAFALNVRTGGTTRLTVGATGGLSLAAANALTVTSALTSLTGATTGDALNVSNSTSTGNIAVFKDNATAVATIADGGSVLLQNSSNSATAFQVQNALGTAVAFDVDTSNTRVGIGTAAPSYNVSFGAGANRTIGVETQTASNTAGNNLTISSGTGNGTGAGGVLVLQGGAGSSTGTGGAGGAVNITAGNAGGSGNNAGGNIVLQAGAYSGSGASGAVVIKNATNGEGFIVEDSGGTHKFISVNTSDLIVNLGTTGTEASSTTVNIGTSTAQDQYVNIGSTASFGVTNIAGGSGGINIGTSSSTAQIVSIGGTSGAAANNTTVLMQGGNTGAAVQIQALASGSISIGTNNAGNIVQIGSNTLSTGTQVINVGNNSTSGGTTNITIGTGSGATAGTTAVQAKTSLTFSTNGVGRVFMDNTNNMYLGGSAATAAAPNDYVLQGVGASAATVAGAAVKIQGGTGNTTGAGGKVTIQGGTAGGSGVKGLIELNGGTYFTTGSYSSGSTATITQSLVDSNSAILASATATSLTFTVPTPTNGASQAGRILYIVNSGSNAFTLSFASVTFTLNPGSTASLMYTGSAWTSAGVDAATLQNAYGNSTGSTTPEILLDTTRRGLDVQDANTTLGSTEALLAVRASATASTLGNGLFVVNASGKIGINLTSTSTTPTISNDLSFGQVAGATTARTIGVEAQTTSNIGGNGLTATAGTGNGTGAGGQSTLQGGTSGTGAAATGGAVLIQGGTAAGSGASNGGKVTIQGGTAAGTGVKGLIELNGGTYFTTGTYSSGSTSTITQSLVDSNSAILASATAGSLTFTVPTPTNGASQAGRILYVTNNGANAFTLSFASTSFTLNVGSTASLVYNGSAWTSAGVDAGTLQNAYANSTGSTTPEVLLDTTRRGLDVQDANTTLGSTEALLAVRASATASTLGNGLFVVNASGKIGINLTSTSTTPTISNDLSFGQIAGATTARTIGVEAQTTSNIGGNGLTVTAGTANGTGQGGTTTIQGGAASSTAGSAGGGINVMGAAGTSTGTGGTGGAILLSAGNAGGSGNNAGGNITLNLGGATGTGTSGSFFVQNTLGANLLTVDPSNTYNGLNLALNPGAEVAGTFATNWTAHAGTGSPTITQTTTSGEFASGTAAVKVATTNANQGVRNNLGAALAVSTTYIVSFSVKSSTSITDLTVGYYRNNTPTLDVACSNYSSQAADSTGWKKISCTFATTSNAGNTTAFLAISQVASATRNIFIDNLSIVAQNSTGTSNVGDLKVGGALSQGLTLLTLDTYAGTPFSGTNSSLAGSMYFDTTSSKIQCYDGSSWGACGAAPNGIVTLTPEYAGAVLNGSGIGTMTSDFCANSGALTVGTLCGTNDARNFYKWTSPQGTAQAYSIYVTYKLPPTFKAFVSGSTSLTGLVDNTTNATVKYAIFKSTGSAITSCSALSTVVGWNGSSAIGTASTWTSGVAGTLSGTTDPSSCSFAAGNNIIFQIQVSANSNASAYAENLNFQYSNQ